MNRRGFVRNSLVGLAGLSGFGTSVRKSIAAVMARARGVWPGAVESAGAEQEAPRLFPTDLRSKEWVQFRAAGYSQPVCGVIYRRGDEVMHGLPLGGVATGYLDVETNGTFGLTSLFNSGFPVRGPLRAPFLGLSVGDKTWVLTFEETLRAENAKEIHYWGHYPIADLEYETTAPISVGLRAWTPFIPGDVLASNIPAAVFEVHLTNTSTTAQKGTLGFNFPGPTQAEAQISPDSPRESKPHGWLASEAIAQGVIPAHRREVTVGGFRGLSVSSEKGTGYALGVIGKEEKPRFGGPLWFDGYDAVSDSLWRGMSRNLPRPSETEFSSSMAVDFALQPGETKTIRILLAWYSPIWKGEGRNHYARMYTKYYKDAVAVAEAVARDHKALLKRVLGWQQVVYTAEEIPVWLRESLVNILHLITKTGYWAVAQPPIGDWCRPEVGLFAMNECPRECPNVECLPCSFYGNVPLVYFFPELALSTLRGYKAYQHPSGVMALIFGGASGGTDGGELATPACHDYQTTLNGPCYVDMVDRYWQRTGDDNVLKEFYPSVKKNTTYTMNLRSGPDGIISMPEGNVNPGQPRARPGYHLDWFEEILWFGMTPHVGGIHLAQVRMAQRMAERVGDKAFVEQCMQWLKQGSDSMENKLWTGQYYLAYYEPESGKKSDLVFGFQLDGDWMCFYHGLPGVFRPDRARTALETVKRTCVALTRYGAVNFANADGTPAPETVGYGSSAFFPPEVWMLAATYMYQGQRELGIKMAKDCMQGIVKYGYTWTQPNIVNGETGKRVYGSDYYQNMMLWAVPAAIEGKDLAKACAPGGLVDRIAQAGRRAGP